MTGHRVLVIGADGAGMSAAHQMLRTARDRGRELAVTVLDAGQHTSYSACGIPYVVSGEVAGIDDLVARTAQEHRAAGIDLRLGSRVTHLDLEAGVATVEGADPVEFDEVVVATGASPVMPAWSRGPAGEPVAGVMPAKDLDDAEAWASRFADGAGERVVVIGGGYIGVEMAEAALRRGLEVALVTRSRVLSTFHPEISARVTASLVRAGVEVHLDSEVEGLEVHEGVVTGVRVGSDVLAAHHVVVALGVRPATDFLAHTDLRQPNGALRPDERGQVAPGVWAAGDCCEVQARPVGEWVYVPLGTHANKLGRVVGENLAGGDLRFPGVLGTAITRFAAGEEYIEIARTGVSTRNPGNIADTCVSLVTEGTTITGYMPGAPTITLLVSADRITRRLLAVEIVGGQGAGKRIDAAAAVLWAGGTVDDLAWMDLSYAPPVATAWEVLQIAARRVAELIDHEAAGG
ncbi:FAD-dependent oxidoreductase [Nocardioides gilvus]|uniref:FAD-dependent oxidoreductase n=1 Tax=Nocardioides gilvus TaxID=1735589 RepID=UPI00194E6C81|nr:FAD-dependent oxidoreductase [Nocardioides gilvus]